MHRGVRDRKRRRISTIEWNICISTYTIRIIYMYTPYEAYISLWQHVHKYTTSIVVLLFLYTVCVGKSVDVDDGATLLRDDDNDGDGEKPTNNLLSSLWCYTYICVYTFTYSLSPFVHTRSRRRRCAQNTHIYNGHVTTTTTTTTTTSKARSESAKTELGPLRRICMLNWQDRRAKFR